MLAMVRTHTTCSNSSKWQFLYSKMHDGVIEDKSTTGCLFLEHLLHIFPVCEDVHCQWFVTAIDNLDSFISRLHIDYGQDGSKDFFLKKVLCISCTFLIVYLENLHDGVIHSHTSHNGWLHELVLSVGFSSNSNIAICLGEHCLESVKVPFGDNPAVILGYLRSFAVPFFEDSLHYWYHFLFHFLKKKYIITTTLPIISYKPSSTKHSQAQHKSDPSC